MNQDHPQHQACLSCVCIREKIGELQIFWRLIGAGERVNANYSWCYCSYFARSCGQQTLSVLGWGLLLKMGWSGRLEAGGRAAGALQGRTGQDKFIHVDIPTPTHPTGKRSPRRCVASVAKKHSLLLFLPTRNCTNAISYNSSNAHIFSNNNRLETDRICDFISHNIAMVDRPTISVRWQDGPRMIFACGKTMVIISPPVKRHCSPAKERLVSKDALCSCGM